jgi:hypothetical protein
MRNLERKIGHILFTCGAFLLLIGLTMLVPINSGSTRAFGVSDVIALSNSAREQFDASKIVTNSSLMNAAQRKAEDMAKLHYFAHVAPDGTTAWDYFKQVSYTYDTAGENLAITNEDASAVVNGWLNSPAHRENLLNNTYHDMGVGMAKYGDYQGHKDTYVVVAFYGTHAATQNVTAATSPAGISSTLKPKFINLPPEVITIVASCLLITGIALEARHLILLNKSHSLT